MICGQAYPASLDHLQETLAAWSRNQPCAARLGFLDPMKYTVNPGAFNHTSSVDYRRWLEILAAGTEGPIISVHFTANQNHPILNQELASMLSDGYSQDYDSIQFRHDYFAVVVSIRGQGDETLELMRRLETNVSEAWSDWFDVVANEVPSPLTSIVVRRLFD